MTPDLMTILHLICINTECCTYESRLDIRPPSFEPRILPGDNLWAQKKNPKVGNRWKDGSRPFKCPR